MLERVEVELKRAELFEAPRHFSSQPSLHEVGFDFLHHWSAAARSTVHSLVPLPAFPSLLVSSCGHLLHLNCYAGYVKTLHPLVVGGAGGGTMESVSMAVMFPCPACRRMGNACLPLPFFSSDPSPQPFDSEMSDASLSIKRSLSFDVPSLFSTALQSFLSHWSAVRPSVSTMLSHTLVQRTRSEPHTTQLVEDFSAQWQQLLRRVRLHYALPLSRETGGMWASNTRLLQSVIAHTVLMWEMTNRNAANDTQPTDTTPSPSSSDSAPLSTTSALSSSAASISLTSVFSSPFSVRTAEVFAVVAVCV